MYINLIKKRVKKNQNINNIMIEVEIRSFISLEKYNELIEFFKTNSKQIKEDYQETFYFDSKQDLRIQKNKFYSKIWMKKWDNIHDEAREEIEVKFNTEDFEKLEQIFLALGYNTEIKWFRTRNMFQWEEVEVCIDYTKGYGHIIELEILTTKENKEAALIKLKEKLAKLNIKQTPKELFQEKYDNYKKNWRELTNSSL